MNKTHRYLIGFLSLILLGIGFSGTSFSATAGNPSILQVIKTPEHELPGNYVINLESSLQPIRSGKEFTSIPVLKGYAIYVTGASVKGRFWHRVRIGFFPSARDAQKVILKVRKKYPGAWISKVGKTEKMAVLGRPARKLALPAKKPAVPKMPVVKQMPTKAVPAAPAPEVPNVSKKALAKAPAKIRDVFEEARKAMATGNYDRAVALYNKLLQLPETPADIRKQSLEFLGLARERKGQLAHARMQYQEYLRLYPEGKDAERVRQRLLGLETQAKTVKPKLRRAKKRSTGNTLFFGSFSQFYRRDINLTDADNKVLTQSALITDVDTSIRNMGEKILLDLRATGGFTNDFLDNSLTDPRISSLYFGVADRQQKYSLRAGRQSLSTSGIINRMDGILASWQATSWAKINLAGGFPVESTTDALDAKDTSLIGASFNLGTFAEHLDFIPYVVNQNVASLTDRQAIGLEARYFDPRRSLFSLFDYDYFFDEINTILVLGNITLEGGSSYRMSADYRYSPSLSTSNALIGQPTIDNIVDLRKVLSDPEIYQLARDRTPRSQNYSVGMSYPFKERFQASIDVTVSALSDIPASQGAPAVEGSRWDVTVSPQVIGNSLLINGDISIFGLRFAKTSTARIYSASVNSRFPFTRNFRINPILKVDFRDNELTPSQWIVSPELRIDYAWRRRLRFELQTGGQWSKQNLPNVADQKSFFVNVGYRYDF